MNKPYYVILTGSLNNAGDFLIKYRAKKLLDALRPDREYVDMDRWKPLTDAQLEIVNKSEGLILLGGPALVGNLYPGIYPLRSNLDDIKAPIIAFGVGWKHTRGHWEDSEKYAFTASSKELLNRISNSNFSSSVRDYHSLNALMHNGINNFVMSGCPALYNQDYIGKEVDFNGPVKRISFSLGVKFYQSEKQYRRIQSVLLELKNKFKGAQITVVFHHAITKEKNPNADNAFIAGHERIQSWLQPNGFEMADISGSAEALIDHYTTCDVHVGFRVHAHIFCSSVSKPSILVGEDGRGLALDKLSIGTVLPAFHNVRKGNNFFSKVWYRLIGRNVLNDRLPQEIVAHLSYEIEKDYPRTRATRVAIDSLFHTMRKFIVSLP